MRTTQATGSACQSRAFAFALPFVLCVHLQAQGPSPPQTVTGNSARMTAWGDASVVFDTTSPFSVPQSPQHKVQKAT